MRPSLNVPPTSAVNVVSGSRPVFSLFAFTIFLSALLLFWIQLIIAKLLLPRLGGTPAVWTTCMLFFQVVLLAGYSYVLFTTAVMGARKQAVLHILLLLLSLLYLPLTFGNLGSISERNNPALWLFGYLLTVIGLPVFIISTTSPLLQKWFTRTGHVSAKDPYFLFAVSNARGLLALLSYPVVWEPVPRVSRQNQLWIALYVVFVMLTLGSSVVVLWKASRSDRMGSPLHQSRHEDVGGVPTDRRPNKR